MTLDTDQKAFVNETVSGSGHIILTGKAGTGKSAALCAAVKAAQRAGMDVLVMAPTAMAAGVHRDDGLDSGTIHHALRWNPAAEPAWRRLLAARASKTDWGAAPDRSRLLFVDEASMVGLWLFEILARDLGGCGRPFDGRRLVFVGDWAQLPPVTTPDDTHGAGDTFGAGFGTPGDCALYHPFFNTARPSAFVLTVTHRADGEWYEALNRVRDCGRRASLASLGVSPAAGRPQGAVSLCYRRVSAQRRNAERLAVLPGREIRLRLRDGETGLKPGCEIVVTSNRAGCGFVNGSRAVFRGVDSTGRMVLDDGKAIGMLADGNWSRSSGGSVEKDRDSDKTGVKMAAALLSRYGRLLDADSLAWLDRAAREGTGEASALGSGKTVFEPYFPALPAYALTVHKAQGMTLPAVCIEDDVFWNIAPERLPYVALSRVSAAERVALDNARPENLYVRPDPAYSGIFARIRAWAEAG